jgi:hypothetical protein
LPESALLPSPPPGSVDTPYPPVAHLRSAPVPASAWTWRQLRKRSNAHADASATSTLAVLLRLFHHPHIPPPPRCSAPSSEASLRRVAGVSRSFWAASLLVAEVRLRTIGAKPALRPPGAPLNDITSRSLTCRKPENEALRLRVFYNVGYAAISSMQNVRQLTTDPIVH